MRPKSPSLPTIKSLLITQEWRDVGSDLAARRASRRAHFLVTALLLGQSLTALAESPAQRQELVAALRQLDALERTVADSAARAPIQPGERYHFDYPRLLADLARARRHPGPSHTVACPAARPSELAGDYRTERSASPSPTTTEAQQ